MDKSSPSRIPLPSPYVHLARRHYLQFPWLNPPIVLVDVGLCYIYTISDGLIQPYFRPPWC